MKQTTYFTFLLLIFIGQTTFAQKKLPIIKANSTSVDIKDDNQLRKNAWTIVPEEKLDVYTTSAKKVTFYTDIQMQYPAGVTTNRGLGKRLKIRPGQAAY